MFELPQSVYKACEEYKEEYGTGNIATRQLFGQVKSLGLHLKQLNGAVAKAKANTEPIIRISDSVDNIVHRLVHSISQELWKGINVHRQDVLSARGANQPPAENPGDDAVIKMIDSGALKVGKGLVAEGLSLKLINHLGLTVDESLPTNIKLRIKSREEAEKLLIMHVQPFVEMLKDHREEPTPLPVAQQPVEISPLVHKAQW
jgi:hypothetical protein